MTGLILDVVIVVVMVLLLIFSIWRGMYKLIFGLVSALLAIILTVVLVTPVSNFVIEKTELDARLATVIDEPLSKTIPNGDIVIEFMDLDGDGEANELGFTYERETHPFKDALADTRYSMLSGVIEGILIKNLDPEAEDVTFISVMSMVVVAYIITAIVFVVLLIVLSILVSILMKIIKRFVTHSYLGYFIDKLLGAVLGLVMAAVVVWGSLAIIRILGTYEWIIPVNNLIASSTLTKALFENNFIYNILVDTVDLKSILDSILSGLSGKKPAVSDPETVEEAIGLVRLVAGV